MANVPVSKCEFEVYMPVLTITFAKIWRDNIRYIMLVCSWCMAVLGTMGRSRTDLPGTWSMVTYHRSQYERIRTNTYEYVRIRTNTYEYIRIHTNTYEYVRIRTLFRKKINKKITKYENVRIVRICMYSYVLCTYSFNDDCIQQWLHSDGPFQVAPRSNTISSIWSTEKIYSIFHWARKYWGDGEEQKHLMSAHRMQAQGCQREGTLDEQGPCYVWLQHHECRGPRVLGTADGAGRWRAGCEHK
jgi:hypothetical protein